MCDKVANTEMCNWDGGDCCDGSKEWCPIVSQASDDWCPCKIVYETGEQASF